jgi:hypothetical protein
MLSKVWFLYVDNMPAILPQAAIPAILPQAAIPAILY